MPRQSSYIPYRPVASTGGMLLSMRIQLPGWDRDGYVFAILCVAVATVLFVLGREFFAMGQWALLYLLIIVFIASVAGVRSVFFIALPRESMTTGGLS